MTPFFFLNLFSSPSPETMERKNIRFLEKQAAEAVGIALKLTNDLKLHPSLDESFSISVNPKFELEHFSGRPVNVLNGYKVVHRWKSPRNFEYASWLDIIHLDDGGRFYELERRTLFDKFIPYNIEDWAKADPFRRK